MDKLIEFLENSDFFEAPASTKVIQKFPEEYMYNFFIFAKKSGIILNISNCYKIFCWNF